MKNVFFKFALLLATLTPAARSMADAGATGGGCTLAGPEDAPLTIEELADFECQYCARGANTLKQALKDFPGKIKLVFRNLPLPFHANARVAAKAMSAICLQNPSLAATFQNDLFANQTEFISRGEPYLYELATKLGADVTKMKSDMAGPAVAQSLADDEHAAKDHSISGTPSFLIGTEKIVGAYPYTEIKKAIERQLAQ